MLKGSLDILSRTWRAFMPQAADDELSPRLDERLARKVRTLIDECLAEKGGDVSARQRAARLGSIYLNLEAEHRPHFLTILAKSLASDRQPMIAAAESFLAAPEDASALQDLRRTIQGAHRQLLKQFNALPDGIQFLVKLRADLIACMGDDPDLQALDDELRSLLSDWFDIGFLTLTRIDWNSPAALLEKLIAYEAVHEIDSWEDLRNRLATDRRCYAFFHPGMPDEPLIFIEVALVNGISRSVQELLDTEAPQLDPLSADTAIFYSISNTQRGLRGISFGNFLIKRVVEALRRDLPNLKTFSTLSPLPGFSRWLKAELAGNSPSARVAPLRKALQDFRAETGQAQTLDEIMQRPNWHLEPAVSDLLKEPLLRLCAEYLHARRSSNQQPLDPVERFHLGNGAVLEQINWLGDVSENGVRQAYAMMVNYLYRLSDIEKNHERYAEHRQIVASPRVGRLLKE